MKRLVILLIAVLLAGCVMPFTSSEGDYPNRLYWVANEAPSGSRFIMFADVNKLSANPTVVDKMGVPAEMAALGLAINSMRMMAVEGMQEGPEVIIVEGAFDLSGIIPIVTERISQASGEKAVEETYGGYVIKSTGGPSYFTLDNKVYLGEPTKLKGVIDVKNGGASALSDFEGVMSRLPDGDFMMASHKMGGGENEPEKMGVSADVDGNIAHTTFIGMFASAAEANEMAGKAEEELGGEGVTIQSVSVDGVYVTVIADMDLTKGAGPFGGMGAPPNPEVEGREISECMDKAHWECEDMNWECQALVDDKCRDLSWECEDQMRECHDPYEWDDRMKECVDDYYYNDLMQDCWPDDWEGKMNDCYDMDYWDAKQRACWEECETIAYGVDCGTDWAEYEAIISEECSAIRKENDAAAQAECDAFEAASVHVNETTNETYYDEYDCSSIWDAYNKDSNGECNAVSEGYSAKANAECDEKNKEYNRKIDDCNDDARACSKKWDEEAQDKWRECERRIQEETEETSRTCQREIEDEWNNKRRECERNIDKSCWDEVNKCHEEAMKECQPKIDECYDRKYQECAGEAGVKGYEEHRPMPMRSTRPRVVEEKCYGDDCRVYENPPKECYTNEYGEYICMYGDETEEPAPVPETDANDYGPPGT